MSALSQLHPQADHTAREEEAGRSRPASSGQGSGVTIKLTGADKATEWDNYAADKSPAAIFSRFGWKRIFEEVYGLKTFYICARDEHGICGVLPMVLHSSRIFGRYLSSLPYFDAAGVRGPTDSIRQALLQKAIEIAQEHQASRIEFRHDQEGLIGLPARTNKVTLDLELPADPEILWEGLKAKVRNQVRKARKEELTAESGGEEFLDPFFRIYVRNMRDLGSPSHSRRFFAEVLSTFPGECRLFCVRMKEEVIAAGFTLASGETMTIPWASSLREYNRYCPSMLLYWEILEYACTHGFKTFNFGRSTPDEGTYRFKTQWGAVPRPLYWHFWTEDGAEPSQLSPDSPKYARAIRLWQRMPVKLTEVLGPRIIRHLS